MQFWVARMCFSQAVQVMNFIYLFIYFILLFIAIDDCNLASYRGFLFSWQFKHHCSWLYFRYREVLLAQKNCRLSAPKKHICNSEHWCRSLSHRRNHAAQFCRLGNLKFKWFHSCLWKEMCDCQQMQTCYMHSLGSLLVYNLWWQRFYEKGSILSPQTKQ